MDASTDKFALPGLPERYSIERELGAGGMATVYLGRDHKLERPIAVKILDPQLAASVAEDRFLQEIKTVARLTHPRILTIYDWGSAEGLLFYVMPYLAGESLHQLIARESQLSVPEAVKITCEIAGALAYAHREGVVHRDIKPENILLHEGEPFLADFGIALAINAARDNRLTATGITIGTPIYMSPEQTLGDVTIDHRCDIYALGCVLYEMLVGQPPFDGPNEHAIIRRKTLESIPSVRIVRDTVPEALDHAITKALARLPADRFSRAADFSEALVQALAQPVGVFVPNDAVNPPAPNSLAVLPFVNMSEEPANEFFSDGITEEILNTLSRVPSLQVAARTSSFTFKGSREDVRAIAKRLHVATVIEGSVRRAGNTVRIATQLVNGETGLEMWGGTYDRDLGDIFAIQDQIAQSIAAALQDRFQTTTEVKQPPRQTVDPDAYLAYLKGRHQWNRRTEGALARGIQFFRTAIELDDRYAAAHAGLADSYVILGIYGILAPDASIPHAGAAARRALELDPTLADAHATLGVVHGMHNWEWKAAEEAFQEALRWGPAYAVARLWYAANCLAPLGRFDEAMAQIDRAADLDPLSPLPGVTRGIVHFFSRDYQSAAKVLRAVVESDPSFPLAHYFLGQVLTELSDADGAIASLEQALAISPDSAETIAALGCSYASAGREDDTRMTLRRLLAHQKKKYVSPTLLAQVFTALGDVENALDHLEEAKKVRALDLPWISMRPVFDPLRQAPRFEQLLRSLGLDAL